MVRKGQRRGACKKVRGIETQITLQADVVNGFHYPHFFLFQSGLRIFILF